MAKVFSAYVEVTPKLAAGATTALKTEASKLGASIGDDMGDKGGKGLSNGLVEGVRKAKAQIDPTLAFQAKLEAAVFRADVAREAQSRTLEIKAQLDAAKAARELAILTRDRTALIKAEADVDSLSKIVSGLASAGVQGGQVAADGAAQGLRNVATIAGPGLVAGALGLGATFGGALAGAILAAPGLLAVGGTIAGTVGLAIHGVGDAISSMFDESEAGAKKFQAAMDQLGPGAQEFVLGLRGIKEELKGVQVAVQDAFFEPLKGIADRIMSSGILETITTGLSGVASTLGNIVSGVFDQLSSKKNQAIFADLFAGTSAFLSSVAPGVQSFFQSMLSLVDALGPKMPAIGAAIGGLFSTLGTALEQLVGSGAFDRLVEQFIAFMGGFSEVTATAIVSLFEALSNPQTMGALVSLLDSANRMAPAFAQILPPLVALVGMLAEFEPVSIIFEAQIALVVGALTGLVWYLDNVTGPAWTAVWDLIKPILKSIGDTAKEMWEKYVEPAFTATSEAFEGVGSTFTMVKSNVIDPVFSAITVSANALSGVFEAMGAVLGYVFFSIKTTASVMWAALQVVFGIMQITFQVLAAAWKLVYDTIIAPVITGIGATFKTTYETVILPVWNSIKTVFDAFGDVLKKYVAPAFEAGVKAIGTAWDKIKEKAGTPVKFVLETVLNNGLLKAYNEIASLFGVKPDNVQVPIPKFAAGGPVRGARTGEDSVLAAVMPGEHVLTTKDVQNLGGQSGVYALRQAAAQGGIPAFAGGGSVPSLLAIMNKSGIPHSVNSTYRNTSDFHGQGLAVDFGGSGNGAIRDRIADYWAQYSGSLLELIHRSDDGRRNWAVKRGKNVGPGYYGEGTMDQHRNHVHVAATQAAANAIANGATAAEVGSDPSNPGGGLLDSLENMVSGLIAKIPGSDYSRKIGGGVVSKVAGVLISKAKDAMQSLPLVGGLFGGDDDDKSNSSGSPQDYAMNRLKNYGWGDNQFAPLNKLWNKESNWRWNATNPSSGAYGIPQALPGNKMASAGNDWKTNPKTQVNWGLDYIKGRYGSPASAWDHSVRTDWYDSGGDLMPGTSLVHNGTGKVESVVTDAFKKDLLNGIANLAGGGSGGGVTIENITVNDRADVDMMVNQLEWRLSGI